MSDYLYVIVAAIIWQNIVLSALLGLTPFLTEARASLRNSLVIGLLTTVMLALAIAIVRTVDAVVLDPAGAGALVYLVHAVVVLALAAAVFSIRNRVSCPYVTPAVARAAGFETALIGLALIAAANAGNVGAAVVEAIGVGLGFTVVLLIVEGIRERLEWLKPASWLAGVPIQLITLGILALVFSGFQGI